MHSTDSECHHVVAISRVPSVTRTFSRDSGAAAPTSATVAVTASTGSKPARSRARTSAHSVTLSVGASSRSSSVTGNRAASGATDSGQPRITPLWLNSHLP